jgi:hypothetical protein
MKASKENIRNSKDLKNLAGKDGMREEREREREREREGGRERKKRKWEQSVVQVVARQHESVEGEPPKFKRSQKFGGKRWYERERERREERERGRARESRWRELRSKALFK